MTSWPLFMISFFTVIMMVQIIIIIRTVHDGDQELYKVKGIKFMFFFTRGRPAYDFNSHVWSDSVIVYSGK